MTDRAQKMGGKFDLISMGIIATVLVGYVGVSIIKKTHGSEFATMVLSVLSLVFSVVIIAIVGWIIVYQPLGRLV